MNPVLEFVISFESAAHEIKENFERRAQVDDTCALCSKPAEPFGEKCAYWIQEVKTNAAQERDAVKVSQSQ